VASLIDDFIDLAAEEGLDIDRAFAALAIKAMVDKAVDT
jgi:pyruvate/oxaloacetate carboxyltransferase